MFSGIIYTIGTVRQVGPHHISIAWDNADVADGASISVNGVCLTVARSDSDGVHFDILGETAQKTTISELSAGDYVHIEPSARVGDDIGGHFVYGHVDGVGTVDSIQVQKGNHHVKIVLPDDLMRYMVEQGSVTIDGVSLTVSDISDNSITVSLVSHTLKCTTLGALITGSRVNVEIDMLAKYLEKIMLHTKKVV
jgi:riboflavin synthase